MFLFFFFILSFGMALFVLTFLITPLEMPYRNVLLHMQFFLHFSLWGCCILSSLFFFECTFHSILERFAKIGIDISIHICFFFLSTQEAFLPLSLSLFSFSAFFYFFIPSFELDFNIPTSGIPALKWNFIFFSFFPSLLYVSHRVKEKTPLLKMRHFLSRIKKRKKRR